MNMVNKVSTASVLMCVLILMSLTICDVMPANMVVASSDVGSNKKIALTFDDGPSQYTSRLLSILSENNATATFFFIGSKLDTYSEVAMAALSQGCEVLGHTWSHPHLTTITDDEIRQELQETNDALFETLGIYPNMFRPPYGEINDNVVNVSRDMGFAIILWSITTQDWASQDADAIYDAIMTYAVDESIILCHDIIEETIDAMERVIPELISKGYDLVTVSELLGETEAGEVYRGSTEIPIHTYSVQLGDTLLSIAESCNTTVHTVMVLNDVGCDGDLYVGQELQLRYVVKRGDNLWLIGQAYNTTMGGLMVLNGLESDLICPGQLLLISCSVVEYGMSYDLVDGVEVVDNLFGYVVGDLPS